MYIYIYMYICIYTYIYLFKSALDAIEAIKLLAEKRDIQLTHSEKEKIPQLMIYFLNKLEKDEIEKEKNDLLYRRKNILSPYLLADCAWGAGTLQLKKSNSNQLDSDLNIQGKVNSNNSDIIPQQWNNDVKNLNNINDFFLTELATQIISSLYLQREAIRGRYIYISYVCIYVLMYMDLYVYIYICTIMCMCIHIIISGLYLQREGIRGKYMHVFAYIMYVYMYLCIWTCIYIYVYIYTYI
jgi:hypothetical protein